MPALERPPKMLWGLELPNSNENLAGTTAVVIDALAATSNIAALLDAGVDTLLLTNSKNILEAKKRYPNALLIGESINPALKDIFAISNVPSDLRKKLSDVRGKTVIYMTTNGTAVIHDAFNLSAASVITASFVNLETVTKYLRTVSTPIVIIPSGERTFANQKTSEDRIGAEMLLDMLHGNPIDFDTLKQSLVKSINEEYRENYLNASRTIEQMKTDMEIILNFNSLFVVPVCIQKEDGLIEVRAIA